jgi:RNA polymerase sigma-70 factor (ECF subfamily)
MSDEDLIMSYADKPKRDILHVLYERYGHLVLGLCIKYMKNMEDAEDMCATVFEKLPKLIEKHEIHYFKSWLYQLSRNECLMVLRKKTPYSSEFNETIFETTGSDEVLLKETKEVELTKMEQALQELKPIQNKCITLFYLEEKSYQQISLEISLPIKAVKSHIQNGKRNLKLVMEAKP